MPNIKDFEHGIKEYYKACMFNTQNTIEQRKLICDKFIDFMQDRRNENIDMHTILDFRNSMTGYKPSTINKYLNILRGVFAWLSEMGYWDAANPVRKNMWVRVPQRQQEHVLKDEDMFRLTNCDKFVHYDKKELRQRAIVVFLTTSALRESELISLRPADLDWMRGTAYVRNAKGGKSRTVLFSKAAQVAVQQYMDEARNPQATDDDPIFASAKNPHVGIYRSTVWRDVREFIHLTTGREDIFPHALRHTCARYMLSEGVPIAEIQTLLGHSSVTMTEHYAKMIAPDVVPIKSAARVFNENVFKTENTSCGA